MRVLITGSRGQLAGAIINAYKETAQVFAYSHDELDVAYFEAVMTRVTADRPDLIVNCASYNNVDRAEEEPEQALTVNAFARARPGASGGRGRGDPRTLQLRLRVRRCRERALS